MSDPIKILNFIGGQYRDPESKQWIDNVCPADGTVVGRIANSGAADVELAYASAAAAFEAWSETPF